MDLGLESLGFGPRKKKGETERRETNLEIKDIPIDVDDLGFRFGV